MIKMNSDGRGEPHYSWIAGTQVTMGKPPARCKVGIALGSGAARGWAHIGVLRTLENAGIVPDIVCGTSIGAVAGALYVVGRLSRLEEWACRLNRVRLGRLFDFHSGGGIIAGRRIARSLRPSLADTTIEALPRRFACVATDLRTGEEVWLQRGSVIDALRASYAVPGIFPPVEIDGRRLVDGALANPVPISLCRALGATLVIGVDVSTHVAPNAADDEAEGRLDLGTRRRGLLHGYFSQDNAGVSAFGVLTRSLNIIQDRISQLRLAENPPDVMICLRAGQIGPLDFDRAAECIAAGEVAAQQMLPAVRSALRRMAA